jgi:hypothetical protein
VPFDPGRDPGPVDHESHDRYNGEDREQSAVGEVTKGESPAESEQH